MSKALSLDYRLTGANAKRAIERGLAEAEWYRFPVPRATMRKLLERRDGPAPRDTLLWFALIFGSGYATYALWGSWWVVTTHFCQEFDVRITRLMSRHIINWLRL